MNYPCLNIDYTKVSRKKYFSIKNIFILRMGKTGKYRSLGLKSKTSDVEANSFFRVIAYFIDAVVIRLIFQIAVFLLRNIGFISETWMENINFYLALGLAPMRAGGITLEGLIFINSLQDLLVHISYSALFIGYFIIWEWKWGETIGKKIFGIKVVDGYGSKISFKNSFLRNSTKYLLRVPILNFLIFIIEMLLLTFYSTRSGDLLAGTKVISKSEESIVSRLKRSD